MNVIDEIPTLPVAIESPLGKFLSEHAQFCWGQSPSVKPRTSWPKANIQAEEPVILDRSSGVSLVLDRKNRNLYVLGNEPTKDGTDGDLVAVYAGHWNAVVKRFES